MPYPRPFVRLTAEGGFGTGPTALTEIWRCNFNFPTNSGSTYPGATLLAFATSCAAKFSAYHGDAGVKAGTSAYLVAVSAAVIDVNGRYVGGGSQATQRYTLPSPVAGTTATAYPWSQAMCISFRTAIVRGPGAHGRVYWPATGMSVGSNGVVTSANQALLLSAGTTLINGLNTEMNAKFGTGHAMSVMSKVGLGVAAPVIRVEYGARMDAQERREGKTSEAYVGGPIVVGLRSVENRDRRYQDALEEALKDLPDLEV